MNDKRCKCPTAISVLGDGCRYCQPQEYIDRLCETLTDEVAEHTEWLEGLHDAVKRACPMTIEALAEDMISDRLEELKA